MELWNGMVELKKYMRIPGPQWTYFFKINLGGLKNLNDGF